MYAHWFFAHAGGITYINVLGQEMVILNSSKAAANLLNKGSVIYSDRPIVMMGGEMVHQQDVCQLIFHIFPTSQTQVGPPLQTAHQLIEVEISEKSTEKVKKKKSMKKSIFSLLLMAQELCQNLSQ